MSFSRKHLLLAFAGFLFCFPATAQEGVPPDLQEISRSLTDWTETFPQEKVYLHTDKPYYATGDTIWFKAYVVVGARHQLSALSGALYVELIDETGNVNQERRLPLAAGTTTGHFPLSSAIKEGNYRLRAYTQWMRNAGPDYFYDITFPVGNVVSQEMTGEITYQSREEKGQQVLLASLQLRNSRQGSPFGNEKVEYAFRKGLEEYTGRGVTDASGRLEIPVPNGFRSNSYLTASIETGDNQPLNSTFPIHAGADTDVQFFPEGGDLVGGVPSRVAFKATGPGGRGVPVSGYILDDRNDTVSALESMHAGMGFFTITPETGRSYRAWIQFPDDGIKEYPLPKAKEKGYTIWAYPYLDPDTLLIRVMANQAAYGRVSLLIHAGGEILNALEMNINRPLNSLRIPCGHFPSGIISLTLFDQSRRPVNERIVFIRRSDTLQLSISAGGAVHSFREHMQATLTANDPEGKPTTGSFSASVINESIVSPGAISEHTIFSELLLRSDLRGYIENPAYYFEDNSRERAAHLDLLMMTQGYRRFTWPDLLERPLTAPEYQAEQLLTRVSGKLLTLGGKPIEGGTVTLFSLTGIMRDTTTNSQGEFVFDNILLGKDVSFSVQGRNAKGGKKVEVVMDPLDGMEPVSPNPNAGDLRNNIGGDMEAYLENSLAQLHDLENNGMTDRVQMLEGVTVTARATRTEGGGYAIPDGHADQTLRLDNPQLCRNLLECLQGKLQGVTFQSTGTAIAPFSRGKRMLVYLNGHQVQDDLEMADIFENNGVIPTDVLRVQVVRTNLALMSLFSNGEAGGALLITTRSGNTRPAPYTPELAHYAPPGFDVTREFYSPRYDRTARTRLSDFRTTIHWESGLITDDTGKAAFDFYNADQPGTYRIVVEGINGAGNLGRAVLRYRVE
ncbi:MAG: hypothetical protein FWJ85_00255 [Solitalea sp.]